MTLKAAVACLAAPFVSSASIPDAITITHHPSVVQVICDQGRGSAFRWRGNAAITVKHVTSLSNCTIGGRPFTVALDNPEQDFSIIRMPEASPGIPVNCDGFQSGERYWAVGFAQGKPYQRLVTVMASDAATKVYGVRGLSVLHGAEYFIPGMSGGPVLNSRGEAVGVVNGYNPFLSISYSQPLRDTAVCQGSAAQ